MAEVRSGIRHVLRHPWAYNGLQNALGIPRQRDILTKEHIRPADGLKILDVGCGTGDILKHLIDHKIDYVGVDANPDYLKYGVERWGHTGAQFLHQLVEENAEGLEENSFDRVIAFGIMHHLDDDQLDGMLAGIRKFLKPTGHLVTMDPVHLPDMNPLEKFLVRFDRGRSIRTVEGYQAHLSRFFPTVKTHVRSGLNRIHCRAAVFECSKTES
jgi:ubiquinone/menaquinone biosynthesis C-methylase UbiE